MKKEKPLPTPAEAVAHHGEFEHPDERTVIWRPKKSGGYVIAERVEGGWVARGSASINEKVGTEERYMLGFVEPQFQTATEAIAECIERLRQRIKERREV